VIVHAVIDAKGNVRESEVLQTSSVSAAALAFVTGMKFAPMTPASGASPTEREAYINVRFQPPLENSNALLH
jgi:TonB family protein